VRQALGEAYAREGKIDAAIVTLQRAVAISERATARNIPALCRHVFLSPSARIEGRDAEARAVSRTPTMTWQRSPPCHPSPHN